MRPYSRALKTERKLSAYRRADERHREVLDTSKLILESLLGS